MLDEQIRHQLISVPENSLRVILGMALAENRQRLTNFILSDMNTQVIKSELIELAFVSSVVEPMPHMAKAALKLGRRVRQVLTVDDHICRYLLVTTFGNG